MSKNNIKNGAAAHREESIVEPAPPADDFICFECGDKFMTRTAWREHLRTHGVEPEPAPPAIPKNIPDPKGFPAEGDSILNPAYVEQLE
nr:hypothetical protein [Candidatus Sigynarchaeum springense]